MCVATVVGSTKAVLSYGVYIFKNIQVDGDGQKVTQAMDEIERREKMLRIPEILERHRYHEKGYNKVRTRLGSAARWTRVVFDT